MICIAAFIILLIIWLFLPVIKLLGFKKQAKSINSMFKKSMHCFTRRVTFRPCDTNFTDEIKQSVLKKVIVNHKNWVKPISAAIEVGAVLIVVISIWSLLTVVKSGLALYVYGTCDVRKPDACSLSSAEACSIDSVGNSNPVVDWFSEWGEVFGALPARIRTWDAKEFTPESASYYGEFKDNKKAGEDAQVAIDIFDPGCIICRRSFTNQSNNGFFSENKTYLLPYVIKGESGDKFPNSDLVARYIEAVRGEQPKDGQKISAEWLIAEKLFMGKDKDGVIWQDNFNGTAGKALSSDKAEKQLQIWLKESGFSGEQIAQISKKAKSDESLKKLEANRDIVENQIKTKRIPTMIFNGQRHEGLYKAENK